MLCLSDGLSASRAISRSIHYIPCIVSQCLCLAFLLFHVFEYFRLFHSHVSNASSFFISAFPIFHVSYPYSVTLQMNFSILISPDRDCLHIRSSHLFQVTIFLIAILLLISVGYGVCNHLLLSFQDSKTDGPAVHLR